MSTTRRRWGNAGQRLTPRPAIDGIRRALAAGLHVGFTGPRSGMTPYQRDRLRARLAELQAEHGEVVFHYGQAVGADAIAGAIAHALGWRIISHPSDRAAFTATVVPGAEVREPKPPLIRNRDIVHESDVLLATPRTVEEELRSGTWATIRYARKVGVPVELIHPLPYHGSRRETAMSEPELMTYGELAEAYRRALAEIDKLRAELAAGLLPPDGARTLRDDLEFYVNDIRRQLPYLAPGGPREMAEQIAYDLQTLLDAQHTPTEETP